MERRTNYDSRCSYITATVAVPLISVFRMMRPNRNYQYLVDVLQGFSNGGSRILLALYTFCDITFPSHKMRMADKKNSDRARKQSPEVGNFHKLKLDNSRQIYYMKATCKRFRILN